MFRILGGHLRNNVVGYIALFFALGMGTAWAATELGKNEVRSQNIAKGQVKTPDIGRNAVTTPKVADGSLLRKDFKAGELPGTDITVRTASNNTGFFEVVANCLAGEHAVGGGGFTTSGFIYKNAPVPSTGASPPTGWTVGAAKVDGTPTNSLDAYVLCTGP
ncbi:MAG: hypothetical protein H0V25_05260 [Solirubrobacterales bacterium]|nr:hypothetical protein [Solirubrobacterales bacterium]